MVNSPPITALDLPEAAGDDYDASSAPPRPTTLNWSLESLLSLAPNFKPVDRVSASMEPEKLTAMIADYEHRGRPLIIEGWHTRKNWDSELLSPEWLARHYPQEHNVWDCYAQVESPMTIADLLASYRQSNEYAEEDESQRLYGKDLIFPSEWQPQIETLPNCVLPFQEGDAFAMMNPADRPETIMCYLGIGDTYTAVHKDSSASTGYNLMLHTSAIHDTSESPLEDIDSDDGSSAGDASSFWFLTAAEDAASVSDYFLNKLGQTLDFQAHYATVDELMGGEFNVYVCQQRLGDLVLIPRQSCHQVVNTGGLTMKVAWSRMPFRSLEAALLEELPVYHRVCRPESYRVKLLIEQSVQSLTSKIADLSPNERFYLPRLLRLLTGIHIEEYDPKHSKHVVGHLDVGLRLTCDCCSADIYQSYLECATCVDPASPSSTYIICPTCYVEGRSCKCRIMTPRMSRPFEQLLKIRNDAAAALQLPLMTLEDYNVTGATPRSNQLPVFQTAIFLTTLRRNGTGVTGKPLTSCNGTSGRSHDLHPAESASVVGCMKCHRTLCFWYLLRQCVHSVEAFLIWSRGSQPLEMWHEWHRGGKARLKTAKQPGSESAHHLQFRLIQAAITYETCRPAAESRTVLGWYDQGYLPAPDAERRCARKSTVAPEFGGEQASQSFKENQTPSSSQLRPSQANGSPAIAEAIPLPLPSQKKRPRKSKVDEGLDASQPLSSMADGAGDRPIKRLKKTKKVASGVESVDASQVSQIDLAALTLSSQPNDAPIVDDSEAEPVKPKKKKRKSVVEPDSEAPGHLTALDADEVANDDQSSQSIRKKKKKKSLPEPDAAAVSDDQPVALNAKPVSDDEDIEPPKKRRKKHRESTLDADIEEPTQHFPFVVSDDSAFVDQAQASNADESPVQTQTPLKRKKHKKTASADRVSEPSSSPSAIRSTPKSAFYPNGLLPGLTPIRPLPELGSSQIPPPPMEVDELEDSPPPSPSPQPRSLARNSPEVLAPEPEQAPAELKPPTKKKKRTSGPSAEELWVVCTAQEKRIKELERRASLISSTPLAPSRTDAPGSSSEPEETSAVPASPSASSPKKKKKPYPSAAILAAIEELRAQSAADNARMEAELVGMQNQLRAMEDRNAHELRQRDARERRLQEELVEIKERLDSYRRDERTEVDALSSTVLKLELELAEVREKMKLSSDREERMEVDEPVGTTVPSRSPSPPASHTSPLSRRATPSPSPDVVGPSLTEHAPLLEPASQLILTPLPKLTLPRRSFKPVCEIRNDAVQEDRLAGVRTPPVLLD